MESVVSIGQALRAARADAGLTLEEVADTVRLRRTLVTAIENDDYELCGGDVYARGHIRNLATVIGIDPAPLLAEFDAERAPRMSTPAEAFDPRVSSQAQRRRPPNWTAAMAVVLVLVLAYAGFKTLRGHDTPGLALAPVVSVAPASSASAASSKGPSVAASPSPGRSAPTGRPLQTLPPVTVLGVKVTLSAAHGSSWVRATDSTGHRIWEGIVRKGNSKSFADGSGLELVLGNAGAMSLTVNGKNVGAPGAVGQVATVTYTAHEVAGGAAS